jgi:carboxyl-terminal processing protease
MSPPMKLASIVLSLSVSLAVYAQDFPYEAQLQRLMDEPNETVSALVIYPWRDDVRISLPGLNETPHGNSIRIVSAERPVSGYSRWSHWNSPDDTIWMDVLNFPSRDAATELLGSGAQLHSGYRWDNQLLLFTNLCDLDQDAVGAALISPTGHLLNVGIKLKMAVCLDKAVTESDRKSLDDGITQLQSALQSLARQLLDPIYVKFDPKISAKPDAVRVLRMAAFSRLWSEVKYNFVYLERRPEVDWDGVLERYMPRIAVAQDDVEYGRILEEVVALLKDGHTNVYPRAVAPEDAPLVRLEPVQGKPVVVAVGNLPELTSLKPGMELVEIDHTPVQRIIERDLDPYIASSTTQDRALREMRMLLKGRPDSTVQTKWLDLQGNTVELTLHRNGSKDRSALPIQQRSRFEYRELPGHISYMALNDFGDNRIVSDFESKLDEALRAKAWILDLRENGGGDSSIGYNILGHFLNAAARGEAWRTRLYNPTFRAWRKPQSWYEGTPDAIELSAAQRYSGPIYILTSPATCSAAEDFLIPLRVQKRATVVGEPTCGSSGQPLSFSIYGADVRVCTKWDRMPDGTEFVGIGIIPDFQVSRTREDVSTGRDAVLEAAIRLASR